jgi:Plavaka transposase
MTIRATKSEVPTYSGTDRAMIQIYQYALQQGTSLGVIDNLFCLIRKSSKELGFDVSKAPLRKTFMKQLRKKMVHGTPVPTCVEVPSSRSCLPKFSFLEQLQDIMSSSQFQWSQNLVVNNEPSLMFGKYVAPAGQEQLEVHSGGWYNRTYDHLITTPHLDVLMPIIFYIDKTGTDVMQRFPLEPLMFTTTLFKHEIREKASSWRHLGFVPPCDDAAATAELSMQCFHDCLATLLSGLLELLQRNPPTVQFIVDKKMYRKRLILPVAFVIGDQLSQDKHCGRKSVNTPIDTTTVSLAIWKCFDISGTPKNDGDNRDRVIPCLATSSGVIYPQNDYIPLRHQHDTPIDTTTVSLAIWKCFDILATPKNDGDNQDRVIPCLATSFGVIYPQNDYIPLRHQHDTPIDTTTVALAIWKCFDISGTPKNDGDNRDRVIPCLATSFGVIYPQNDYIRLRLDQP